MMKTFTEKNSNRTPLGSLLPLLMPLGLCIEPTNLCNFRCVQCPVSLPEFKAAVGYTGNMDMKLYDKILAEAKAMGRLKNLNLYGDGEPLLNKNIAAMVRKAVDLNIAETIAITTNASLLTPVLSKELIESGLTYLRVSIYSVIKDKNRQITKSNIEPGQIYDNIKEFKRLRDQNGARSPFIYIKMIDTYSEENQMFIDMYKDLADEINIETPMNWNGFNNINLIEQIDPGGNTDETLIQGFYKEKGRSGYKKICTTGFHSLNIKSNGDVVICIVDWNRGTKVGNVSIESLKQIWFGERLREFRNLHIRGRRSENVSCQNCNYLYCNPDNIDNLSENKFAEILNFRGI